MKQKITFIILVILIVLIIGRTGYRWGYGDGRNYGITVGVTASLDTVEQILYKQLDNDSCATKLIFDGDTSSYVLTKKILIEKFNQ